MDAKTAELIVSNNLGGIMKRIRKAVEKNETKIGWNYDRYGDTEEAPIYIDERQFHILTELGYKVETFGNEFENNTDTIKVYIRWTKWL